MVVLANGFNYKVIADNKHPGRQITTPRNQDRAPMLPGENIAQASQRLAKEWNMSTNCCRQWVNGQRSFKKGIENAKRQMAIDEGLRIARELQAPGEAWTLEQIAEVAGCTRERIRQIESEALKKVRNATQSIRRELEKTGGAGIPKDTRGENYGVD